MKKYGLLFLALSTWLATSLGCSNTSAGEISRWEDLSLAGKGLELIDDKRIENYTLMQEGWATAVQGERDGAVTGPVLYWKISDGNLLLSEDRDFAHADVLPPPRVNGTILTVRRSLLSSDRFKLTNNR